MIEYTLPALIFGLAAGLNPGPLTIIVIQQTLEHGLKNGIKASLAPLITDGPIILVAFIALTQLKNIELFIGLLSAIGGLYLLWVSRKMLSIKKVDLSPTSNNPESLSTAIKINLLSPYPYLFWFTVGGTYISLGSLEQSAAFIIIAISTLVLSKMFIAWIASNFRQLLEGKVYLWVMRILALSLSIFGILLLIKAYNIWA